MALVIFLAIFESQNAANFSAVGLASLPDDLWRRFSALPILALPNVEFLIKAAISVSSLLLLVGCRTKVATVLCFCCCGLASVWGVGQFWLLNGALLPILFWSYFLPLGAVYSLDSATNTAKASLPASIVSGATIALIVQQCFNYWLPETLFWSATFGPNSVETVGSLSNAVWVAGLSAPLVLFLPVRVDLYRCVLILLFGCIHTIAFLFLDQPALLHLMAIATWIVFLPRSVWEALAQRIDTPSRRGLVIYYDADCGFCKKVVHVLRTALILPGTPLLTAQSDPSICADMEAYNSWVVVDWQQNRRFKFAAIAYICSLSPVFRFLTPILRWPPVMGVGTRFYEAIANNRKRAALLTKFLKFQARPLRTSRLENCIAGLSLGAYGATHLSILTWSIYDFVSSRT